MENAILILIGPATACKLSIIERIKEFELFKDYTVVDHTNTPDLMQKFETDFLINIKQNYEFDEEIAMNVFIDCNDFSFDPKATNDFCFQTNNDENECTWIAGAIIAKHVTWRKAHGMLVEY
jgi:hypothetical protein